MKTDISMEYNAMAELAKQVSDMQTEFSNMLSSLDRLVESVNGQWKGAAQVEFAITYEKLRPRLSKISEVLSNYSAAINNAIIEEKDIESLNKILYQPIPLISF